MAVTSAEQLGRHQTRALGTRVEIITTDPGAIGAATGLLVASLESVDGVASRFRADSELSDVNARAGRPFPASAALLEMLAVALRAARITDGVVTPTVGRAICEIGYDRDFSDVRPDRDTPLPPAAPVPDWESIEVDPFSGTVRVPRGVQIDLGATAKAWAADHIAARASESLGCGVLVSLGGDVSVAGPSPPGGWRVGVADMCEADATDADVVVCLQDGGLATSGTATRSWRRAGRTVHHLIDPATGLPADSCWRTVSVAAASCVDANIAATAAVIKGAGALQWLGDHGLPARLVGTAGQVVVTGGWPAQSRH